MLPLCEFALSLSWDSLVASTPCICIVLMLYSGQCSGVSLPILVLSLQPKPTRQSIRLAASPKFHSFPHHSIPVCGVQPCFSFPTGPQITWVTQHRILTSKQGSLMELNNLAKKQCYFFFVAGIPYALGTDSDLNSPQRQYRHVEKERDDVNSY